MKQLDWSTALNCCSFTVNAQKLQNYFIFLTQFTRHKCFLGFSSSGCQRRTFQYVFLRDSVHLSSLNSVEFPSCLKRVRREQRKALIHRPLCQRFVVPLSSHWIVVRGYTVREKIMKVHVQGRKIHGKANLQGYGLHILLHSLTKSNSLRIHFYDRIYRHGF